MKKKLICIILSFMLILTAICIRISLYYEIACDSYAKEGVKGIITKNINEVIALNLSEWDIDYSNFANINYLSDGRIASITLNTAKINLLGTILSNNIYNCIENSESNYGIPIGNILGYKYLSGKGFKIKVTVTPIGAVNYEIKSELLSGGINQTLHRVSIDFQTEIKCIAPFHEVEFDIKTTVIITETLIVGEIPNVILPSLR